MEVRQNWLGKGMEHSNQSRPNQGMRTQESLCKLPDVSSIRTDQLLEELKHLHCLLPDQIFELHSTTALEQVFLQHFDSDLSDSIQHTFVTKLLTC